MAVTLEERTPK